MHEFCASVPMTQNTSLLLQQHMICALFVVLFRGKPRDDTPRIRLNNSLRCTRHWGAQEPASHKAANINQMVFQGAAGGQLDEEIDPPGGVGFLGARAPEGSEREGGKGWSYEVLWETACTGGGVSLPVLLWTPASGRGYRIALHLLEMRQILRMTCIMRFRSLAGQRRRAEGCKCGLGAINLVKAGGCEGWTDLERRTEVFFHRDHGCEGMRVRSFQSCGHLVGDSSGNQP
jgi:hypothetical protein